MNNASKPGVKTQIVDMSINGSGVRDTVRVGTVKLSKIESKGAIFLDFRQQEVFE
ncbi:IS1-like element transposase [Rickettsia endosymbiont of Cantharis rufa]|uniref:IS1-like element transposase n=1 Tax=Rickettsia endosymbiont of Cantharis rufa TaxID=3066248 RepID=UPI003132FA5A